MNNKFVDFTCYELFSNECWRLTTSDVSDVVVVVLDELPAEVLVVVAVVVSAVVKFVFDDGELTGKNKLGFWAS